MARLERTESGSIYLPSVTVPAGGPSGWNLTFAGGQPTETTGNGLVTCDHSATCTMVFHASRLRYSQMVLAPQPAHVPEISRESERPRQRLRSRVAAGVMHQFVHHWPSGGSAEGSLGSSPGPVFSSGGTSFCSSHRPLPTSSTMSWYSGSRKLALPLQHYQWQHSDHPRRRPGCSDARQWPGSPAIDHGGASATGCPATDQRGVSRPKGPACDIGAYERRAAPPSD